MSSCQMCIYVQMVHDLCHQTLQLCSTTVWLDFHCICVPVFLVSTCITQRPRTSWFLFETDPCPACVGLRGIRAVPATSLLPLRARFILSADICFAPAAHALPTSIHNRTMNETEDSGDKDIKLGSHSNARWTNRGRGLQGTSDYSVTVKQWTRCEWAAFSAGVS